MFKIAYSDWREQRIKNQDCVMLLLLGVAEMILRDFSFPADRVIGAFCISFPMLLLSVLYPGGFGGGDIKLMVSGGFFLGWRKVCLAAEISVFLSAGYAVWMILGKKAEKKTRFAFGPFLCMGMSIARFFP